MQMSQLDGSLDAQLESVGCLAESLKPVKEALLRLQGLDKRCRAANIEDNDYTIYSYEELEYEYSLARESCSKKLAFLEQQLKVQGKSNLTSMQLEEFESVFRHFDRDHSNSLGETEFCAALASLGLGYDEEEMESVFSSTSGGSGRVGFEPFIRFMVAVTEDQNSPEQVLQSFAEVADGKTFVTEADLRHSLVPEPMIEKLVQIMPRSNAGGGYDYEEYMTELLGVTNGS